MDILFEERLKVIQSFPKDARDRIEMINTQNKYKKKLQKRITRFYQNHQTSIDRMIQIIRLIKTSIDEDTLNQLQQEYHDFVALIDNTSDDLLLCEIFLNKDMGTTKIINPNWDVNVTQEWLQYWGIPQVVEGSDLSKIPKCYITLLQKYETALLDHKQVFGLYSDYNPSTQTNTFRLSLKNTILYCHLWRQELQLNHLNAIAANLKE
jgi:hypothetical protein